MKSLVRKLAYLQATPVVLRLFFSIFYERRYLRGYYFDDKRLGWFWAARSLRSRLFGDNRRVSWPVHPRTQVSGSNVSFHPDDLHIFQTPGCYWQTHGASITVGKGSYIAPNVGLITTNHDVNDLRAHAVGRPIVLGERNWVGMNAVILPGVELGPDTVVAAGAVVSHSFPLGNCVLGGVPARIIRTKATR